MDNKLGKETGNKHIELGAGRMQRDERDVCMIKSCLERRLSDMWDPTKRITNLATGVTADEEMTRDTLDIKEKGEVARDKFIESITSIENKQSYYSPIKKQNIKLFNIKSSKKKQSIAVDEYQSFTEVFSLYDQNKLDLPKLMEWPVTSKPWAIVNEDMESRNNQKSIFRNELQLSTNPPLTVAPEDIETSIVDGMRVVRLITVSELTQKTFRCWVI